MSRNTQAEDLLESDPVWKLLDEVPTVKASDRFQERTLRAVRLDSSSAPWWRHLFSPAPIVGLVGATAASVVALISINSSEVVGTKSLAARDIDPDETFAEIQEVAEMEALLAAVDQMDDFSDHELVSLIGF
jgi:hypothetical protein